MNRFFAGCMCASALWWAALPANADSNDKGLIIAGEQIGQIQINKVDQDLSALGEPSTSDAAMGGKGTETWFSKSPDGKKQELTIYTYPTDPERRRHFKTAWVYVTSPFFHTAAGVSTQSAPAEIWSEFPDLQYQGPGELGDTKGMDFYVSTTNGIGFLIERDPHPLTGKPWGKCLAIMVFGRGQEIESITAPRIQG